MELIDSRRLTGPNLVGARPGAVCDVRLSPDERDAFVAAWEAHARRMLDAIGWPDEVTRVRVFDGGANLSITAPIDALYAATEVNEWTVGAAGCPLEEGPPAPFASARDRLAGEIAGERNPPLIALEAAAAARGVRFLSDDDLVSVGSGRGSSTFPVGAIPDPAEIDWSGVSDVPVALITGTNGKTTTTRLLAAIAAADGRVAGISSTDGIVVDGRVVDAGDWSGPGGARAVLRDRRVEVAFLETARGGMLRRGLGVRRADAALVTNVGEDHLGEFGVQDLGGLAETKLVVARAIDARGRLILNADDAELRHRGAACGVPVGWFTEAAEPRGADGLAGGIQDGRIVLFEGGRPILELPAAELPITLGGAARHNVMNALAAALVARTLGFSPDPIERGLRALGSSSTENPGRLNVFELGGVTAIVDFAHNPHGFRALLDVASALPARRRLVVLGQAGDRDDDAIRSLGTLAGEFAPDRLIVKEMESYLRGRAPGDIPRLLIDAFVRAGGDAAAVETTQDELEAVEHALAWAETGDLLVLTVHESRDPVLRWLEGLRADAWRPGTALPPLQIED